MIGLVWTAGTAAGQCPTTDHVPATAMPRFRPDAFPDAQQRIARDAATQRYAGVMIGDSIVMRWTKAAMDRALGTNVLNAGVGGDGTNDVLYRLRHTPWGATPRFIVLLVGTNDSAFPECDIVAGILADVKAARDVFPAAKVIVVGVLPRGQDLAERASVIQSTNAMLARAEGDSGFTFVDVNKAFLEGCSRRTPCPLYVPGDLHPSDQGYHLLGRMIKAALPP
jgi:platelet-activating factor acetylhydrolase IB subunit beta/gamma